MFAAEKPLDVGHFVSTEPGGAHSLLKNRQTYFCKCVRCFILNRRFQKPKHLEWKETHISLTSLITGIPQSLDGQGEEDHYAHMNIQHFKYRILKGAQLFFVSVVFCAVGMVRTNLRS